MNTDISFASDYECSTRTNEEIISSKVFDGKFTGFIQGDYLHAEFIDNTKEPLDLFIQTTDTACFLALHKSEKLRIEYNEICQYFEYGSGIYPSEKITQIKAKKDNFKTWKQKFNLSRNYDACNQLVDKYTRIP